MVIMVALELKGCYTEFMNREWVKQGLIIAGILGLGYLAYNAIGYGLLYWAILHAA